MRRSAEAISALRVTCAFALVALAICPAAYARDGSDSEAASARTDVGRPLDAFLERATAAADAADAVAAADAYRRRAEEALKAGRRDEARELLRRAAVTIAAGAPGSDPKRTDPFLAEYLAEIAATLTTFEGSLSNVDGPTGAGYRLGRLGTRTGDPELDRLIVDAGVRYRVDPALIYAVMRQESTLRRYAVSPKGASGFMQLMPETARRFGVTDVFDPKQNIDAGTRYLRLLLDLFGDDVELALAAYNAGEGRVIRAGYRVPPIPETQNYVRVITARYGRTRRTVAEPRPESAHE